MARKQEFLPKHSTDRVLCEPTGDKHNLITLTPSLTVPRLFFAVLAFLTWLVDSFDILFTGDVNRSPAISRVMDAEADLVGGEDLSLFVP